MQASPRDLSGVTGVGATNAAESLQFALVMPTWDNNIRLEYRGTESQTIVQVSENIYGSTASVPDLVRGGFTSSAISTFEVSNRSGIVGVAEIGVLEFASPIDASTFYEGYSVGSDGKLADVPGGIVNIQSSPSGCRGTSCEQAEFAFRNHSLVFRATFSCASGADCDELSESIGSSIYKALGH